MAEPEFVASLTEERVAEMRRSLAPMLVWSPWVFNPLTAALLLAGCAILATQLPFPFAPDSVETWLVPFAGMVAGLVAVSLLSALFGAPLELHYRLTALSSDTDQCREALSLVQSSPACQAYQARVLAHPREFMVADLRALKELVRREKEAAITRERQAVCAALHQLDLAKK
jgi:hypothetical protein